MNSVNVGMIDLADAKEWENVEDWKRQSNLRHTLSLIYGESESQNNVDNADNEGIRATITFTDDEVDDDGENLKSESSESSSFSLSDIEVESIEDEENDAIKKPEREFYNVPKSHENNIGSSLNISYANSTLSNPSCGIGNDVFIPNSETTETLHINRDESVGNQISPFVSQKEACSIENSITTISNSDNKSLLQRKKHDKIKDHTNSLHNSQVPKKHRNFPLHCINENKTQNQNATNKEVVSRKASDVIEIGTHSGGNFNGQMMSPSQGEIYLKEDRIKSLESQLKHVMTEKYNLQEQIGKQRTRLEDMALSREDIKEELALLKSLWEQAIDFQQLHRKDSLTNISAILGSSPRKETQFNFPKLKNLRGTLLQEAKENLASKSAECNRLEAELIALRTAMESKNSHSAAENSTLNKQERSLSPQKLTKMPPPSLTQTLNSLKEKSRRKEHEMKSKLEHSEIQIKNLNKQLDQLEDEKEIILKRAKDSEQELENLKNELQNSPTKEYKTWKSKAQSLQRERDGLREEVNDLIRSRGGKPQKSIERRYQVELNNMRQVTEQIKAEADQKIAEAKIQDDKIKEKLEFVQQEKIDATRNKELWKKGLHSVVDSLKKMENAGHLSITCANLLAVGLSSELTDLLPELIPNEAEIPTLPVASSIFNSLLENRKDKSNPNNSKFSSSSTQTSFLESTKSKINTVSAGINTDFTSTSIHDIEGENLQLKSALTDLEQKVSKVEMDNANLKGSNQHLKEQVDWYQNRLKEYQSKIDPLQTPPNLSSTAQSTQGLAAVGSFVIEDFNKVQMDNARYQQEIEILKETRKVVEDENKKILKQYVTLERITEDATKECERLSKHVDDLKSKSNMLLEERNNILDQLRNLSNENSKLMKGELAADEKNKSLSKSLNHLKEKYDKLEKMKLAEDLVFKNLEREKVKLEMSLLESKNQLNVLQSKADKKVDQENSSRQNLLKKYDALLKLNQTEMDKNKAKDTSFQEMERKNDSLQEVCKNLKHRLYEAEETIKTLEEKRRQAEVILKDVEHEKDKFYKQNIELSDTILTVRSECELMKSSNIVVSNLRNGLEEQCSSLHNEVSSLKSKIDTYESKVNSLNEELLSRTNEKTETEAFLKELKTENNELMELNKKKEENLIKVKNEVIQSRTKIDLMEKDLRNTKIELENSLKKELTIEKNLIALQNQLDQTSASKKTFEKDLLETKSQNKKMKRKIESCGAELSTKKNVIDQLTKGKKKIEEILGSVQLEANSLLMRNAKLKEQFNHMTSEKDALNIKIESNKSIIAQLNLKVDALTQENAKVKDELASKRAEIRLQDASRASTEIDRFYLNDERSFVREDIELLKSEMVTIKDGYKELSAKKPSLQTEQETFEGFPMKHTPNQGAQNHDVSQNISVASEKSPSKNSRCYIVTDDGDLRVKTTIYGRTPISDQAKKLKSSEPLLVSPTLSVHGKDSVRKDTLVRPRQIQLSCHKKSKIFDSPSNNPVFSMPLSSNTPENIKNENQRQRKSEVELKFDGERVNLDEKLSRLKLVSRRAARLVDTHINKQIPSVRNKSPLLLSKSAKNEFESTKTFNDKQKPEDNFEDIEETEAFVMQILDACGN